MKNLAELIPDPEIRILFCYRIVIPLGKHPSLRSSPITTLRYTTRIVAKTEEHELK
jgi:hypothetical protein